MAYENDRILQNELKYLKLGFDYLTVDDSLTLTMLLTLVSLVLISTIYLMSRPRKVYLVNFSCYKPDPSHMCSGDRLSEISTKTGVFSEEILDFQKKITEGSGIGSMSYVPKALMDNPLESRNIAEARKETEAVIIGAVDKVLAKTEVKPSDIGILIVNCSMFSPAPSLSAMVVNHYKFRSNILSYNIGGMGCNAGLISVDLAQTLLQIHPNTYALVVSTENIILPSYIGNNRSMAISNCVFRMGGAAILLSNRSSDRRSSKYQLVQTLRSHMGSEDKCYNCIAQQEDESQNIGIKISKDLITVVGQSLKTHIASLGPLVLPMSEQLLFLASSVARKIFKMKVKQYIPDFKLAFEHFCIHVGGKPVLDGVEKKLSLSEWHMEPSRMALYRFGNTSSSSVWYVLGYCEGKGRIRKGDRIWQISFGSGFKCTSVVWSALRNINPDQEEEEENPWMDEIDDFPVEVSNIPILDIFQK